MKNVATKILSICIIFSMLIVNIWATPEEVNVGGTLYYWNFKMEVPEGFQERIVIDIIDTATEKKEDILLSPNNDYSGKIMGKHAKTYELEIRSQMSDTYEIVNVPDKICITDTKTAEVNTTGVVQPKLNGAVVDLSVGTEEVVPTEGTNDYEVSSEVIALHEEGQQVMRDFIEKMSFIKEDEETYKYLHEIQGYNSALQLRDYLLADPSHTEESWEQISLFDKFVYEELYDRPHLDMFYGGEPELEMDYMDRYESTRYFLENNVPRGEEIADAIEEVRRWQFKQWKKYGTFPEFFESPYGPPKVLEVPVEQVEEQAEEELVEEEKESVEVIAPQVEEEKESVEVIAPQVEEEKENVLVEILKDNWVTLIILVIVGIALLIMKRRNEKKLLEQSDEE